MKLNPRRIMPWYRSDRVEGKEYVMQIDDLVMDVDELRAAIDAGLRIGIFSGAASDPVISLEFLAPVIGELRHLWVNAERLIDVELLDGARSLQSLELEVWGTTVGRANLSALPDLQEFSGRITRPFASVLANPGLRRLTVDGAIPKSFAQIAGAIESFRHVGGRSQTELPHFPHPEALRSLSRVGPASFDLDQLAGMTRLEKLEVSACDDVIGLSDLSRFAELSDLTFNKSRTRERWEDLPYVSRGALMHVTPSPSPSFLEDRRAAGWVVPSPAEAEPIEALTVDESGTGESWGVYLSRFDDLSDAVDALDGSVPGGMEGEALILGVVAELRAEGAALDVEPDSEGSFTAVYFPNQVQAEQVFCRAREALAADVETQLRYLRAGRE